MPSMVFPGKFSSLAEISAFIAEHAQLAGFDEKATYAIQLAVDEACSNIIEHAYGGEGFGEIECTCNLLEDGLEIVLHDSGKTFDPDSLPEMDIGVPLEELGNRGAGVYLMNRLMDEVSYNFSQQSGTTLIMRKKK